MPSSEEMGTIEVFCRQVGVRDLVASIRNNDQNSSKVHLEGVGAAVHAEVLAGRFQRPPTHVLTFNSAEELLSAGERLTDFFILELAEHFRQYDARLWPSSVGVRYWSQQRRNEDVRKRPSGHITGSFAEAMCPWVFRQLSYAQPGDFRRLKALTPTALGSLVPDFVVDMPAGPVPCEVKHAIDASRVRYDVTLRAVAQVAAAMAVMGSPEGYVVFAIGEPDGNARYRIEVVRLG